MVDPRGSHIVFTPPRSLWWAADSLVEALGADALQKLDVRAGEHLAAILTTCFLKTPPVAVDAQGGLDLIFDQSVSHTWQEFSETPLAPAFEIKSLAGPFRQFERKLDYVRDRGRDPSGMDITVPVYSANQLLVRARPQLDRAVAQLRTKTSPGQSPNAFLVIHPFDGLAAELIEEVIIAPHLMALDRSEVDTVWVLWAPEHLTVWSRVKRRWADFLFSAFDSEADEELVDLHERGLLQGVEEYFLDAIGHTRGSPFLFGLAARECGEE